MRSVCSRGYRSGRPGTMEQQVKPSQVMAGSRVNDEVGVYRHRHRYRDQSFTWGIASSRIGQWWIFLTLILSANTFLASASASTRARSTCKRKVQASSLESHATAPVLHPTYLIHNILSLLHAFFPKTASSASIAAPSNASSWPLSLKMLFRNLESPRKCHRHLSRSCLYT